MSLTDSGEKLRAILALWQGLSESTKGHVWKLAYYEAFASEKDAREREHKLKHLGYSWRHLKNRIRNSLTEI
jgi:hypothetical protein